MASSVYCLTCVKTLSDWYAGKNVPMKFSVPMIWRDQKYHANDCYFCQHDFTGCNKAKKKKPIVYSDLQSAMRPVEHSENLPALKCSNLPALKKCRVPSVLMNIPVMNMWSPVIQKLRINQYSIIFLTEE